MAMDRAEQRRIVEALVLASPEPITAVRIGRLVPDCKAGLAKDLINELNTEYQEQDRAFEIWEVAGGYQIRTRAEFSGYLLKLQKQRPLRLSPAALETLSIVAYKQPATRAEIEFVRGVEAGPVIKNLLERQLVKIVGHREVPGRPMIYGTTRRFLELFGLASLKDLPPLRELEELAREHGIDAGDEDVSDEAAPNVVAEGALADVSAGEIVIDLDSEAPGPEIVDVPDELVPEGGAEAASDEARAEE